jgi:hypothetical protein
MPATAGTGSFCASARPRIGIARGEAVEISSAIGGAAPRRYLKLQWRSARRQLSQSLPLLQRRRQTPDIRYLIGPTTYPSQQALAARRHAYQPGRFVPGVVRAMAEMQPGAVQLRANPLDPLRHAQGLFHRVPGACWASVRSKLAV